MKKILFIVLVLTLCTFGNALACDGPWCSDTGELDLDVDAGSHAISGDISFIYGGIAGGFGFAQGDAHAAASGSACYGTVSGDADITAGGLTSTNAYRGFFWVPGGLGTYVGSVTHNQSVTSGEISLSTRALFGQANGTMFGHTEQASLNGSSIYTFGGHSSGIAGQKSYGGFGGKVGVMSFFGFGLPGSDTIGASVDMTGSSYSESYRWSRFGWTGITSEVGTRVGASTNITSSVTGNDPWWFGNSHVDGGWSAHGGAASASQMNSQNGSASATAVGGYSGSGSLGTNYSGSSTGGTYASSYQAYGMNGSIMSAGASMSVTSSSSYQAD